MENLVPKVVLTIAGCALLIFNKPFVGAVLDFQTRAFHQHFGKLETRMSFLVAQLIGVVAIITGILGLFGVIK